MHQTGFRLLFLTLSSFLIVACQLLGPTEEELAQQKLEIQINLLFEKIDKDISEKRLTLPKDNNALQKLNEVIVLQADHPRIPEIKNNIAQSYLDLIAPALEKNRLESAQNYFQKALQIAPGLADSSGAESLITDYIEEQERLAAIREAEKQKKLAEAKAAAEREKRRKAIALKIAKEKERIERLTITRLDQTDINARSKLVGIALDKVSPEIVKSNKAIVIQSQSKRDYKWLSALLRTSVYFIDSDFVLNVESDVKTDEPPRVRYLN